MTALFHILIASIRGVYSKVHYKVHYKVHQKMHCKLHCKHKTRKALLVRESLLWVVIYYQREDKD